MGGMPHQGVNAIDHLADFIHAMDHRLKPELAKCRTEMRLNRLARVLPESTFNLVFSHQPEHWHADPLRGGSRLRRIAVHVFISGL
jgi:succinyl-diaminopimelate desuccinylase